MTDFAPTEKVKLGAGWSLVGITLFNFSINTLIALGASLLEIYQRIKFGINIC